MRAKKKSRAERKDYIGDFGFRVSSGRKADFPDFPSFPRREPTLELDVHCAGTETRVREVGPTLLPPTS